MFFLCFVFWHDKARLKSTFALLQHSRILFSLLTFFYVKWEEWLEEWGRCWKRHDLNQSRACEILLRPRWRHRTLDVLSQCRCCFIEVLSCSLRPVDKTLQFFKTNVNMRKKKHTNMLLSLGFQTIKYNTETATFVFVLFKFIFIASIPRYKSVVTTEFISHLLRLPLFAHVCFDDGHSLGFDKMTWVMGVTNCQRNRVTLTKIS